MQSRRRAFSPLRAAVSGLLVAHLMWVLALAAAPEWHAWVHPEAAAPCAHGEHAGHDEEGDGDRHDGDGHQCAVTLFLAGACDCAPLPAWIAAPGQLEQRVLTGGERSLAVCSFRSRAIFEHAPPRRA